MHGSEPHYFDLDLDALGLYQLGVCSACGAVVHARWEERHTEWHAWLGRTIGVVA